MRGALVAVVVVALLALGYAMLHATTLDEAWGRPVSRGLQAAIALAAAAALALRVRGRRPARWIAAVGYALVLFAGASILLERAHWVPAAAALSAAWAAALVRAGRDAATPRTGAAAPD